MLSNERMQSFCTVKSKNFDIHTYSFLTRRTRVLSGLVFWMQMPKGTLHVRILVHTKKLCVEV